MTCFYVGVVQGGLEQGAVVGMGPTWAKIRPYHISNYVETQGQDQEENRKRSQVWKNQEEGRIISRDTERNSKQKMNKSPKMSGSVCAF